MSIAFDRYAWIAGAHYVDLATGRRVVIARVRVLDDDWRRRWRVRVAALMASVEGLEGLVDAGDDGADGVFEVRAWREAAEARVCARNARVPAAHALAWLRAQGLCAGPCRRTRLTARGRLVADMKTAWPIETPGERREARRQFSAWRRAVGVGTVPATRLDTHPGRGIDVADAMDRRAGLVALETSVDEALMFARRSGRIALAASVDAAALTKGERRRSAVLLQAGVRHCATWSVAWASATAARHYYVPARSTPLVARERAPAYAAAGLCEGPATTRIVMLTAKADAALSRGRLARAVRVASRAAAMAGNSRAGSDAAAIRIRALRCQGQSARAWTDVQARLGAEGAHHGVGFLIEAAECATDCGDLQRGEALARAAAFNAVTADAQRRARDALDRARVWRGEAPEGEGWRARAAWHVWGHTPSWPPRGGYAHAPCGPLAHAEWLCDALERARWHNDQAAASRLASRLIARLDWLPPLLRARAEWLTRGSPALARRLGAIAILHTGKGEAHMEILEHLSTLLAIGHECDPETALRQAAAGTRRIVNARALAVFVQGRALPLCGDGEGWNAPSPSASRAIATIAAVDAGRAAARAISAAVPVRQGEAAIGAIAAEWPSHEAIDARRVRLLLEAAALAVAPVLRAWRDTATAPPSADMPEIVGASPAMTSVRDAVRRVARVPFPVLVEGESGSGKELIARAVHRLSPRAQRPFRALNCAAMAEELVEGELFGHAHGAFTGAVSARAGLFEDADRGTVFLDEVSELSPRAQAKLLRVLQESEVRRIGETAPRRIDVRVVAASNRPLRAAVEAGAFRADLLFRLDVLRIDVPPLRDRPEDIGLLAAHFWREAAGRAGTLAALAPDVVGQLAAYRWPGNVRELQNVIAALAVAAPRRGIVRAALLPAHVRGVTLPSITLHQARATLERDLVRGALARAGGRPSRAAAELGVSRQGLAKLMRRLGLPAA